MTPDTLQDAKDAQKRQNDQPRTWRMYQIDRGKNAPNVMTQVDHATIAEHNREPVTHIMARSDIIAELAEYGLAVRLVASETCSKNAVYLGRGGE